MRAAVVPRSQEPALFASVVTFEAATPPGTAGVLSEFAVATAERPPAGWFASAVAGE